MNKIKLHSHTKQSRKRPGRGISSGQGKTAGRGTKGQNSRAGHNIPKRFEGGQTPLSMRLPKLPGFKRRSKKVVLISLDMISNNFKNDDIISIENLVKKALIKKGQNAKILNNGKLTVKVSVSNVLISKSAKLKFISDKPVKAKTVTKTVTKKSGLNK